MLAPWAAETTSMKNRPGKLDPAEDGDMSATQHLKPILGIAVGLCWLATLGATRSAFGDARGVAVRIEPDKARNRQRIPWLGNEAGQRAA